jgi:arylsulfatase A-like enzyme
MMAEAESNYTTPTVTSLMTGQRLWTHQTYHAQHVIKSLKSDVKSLPLLLKNNGYSNMAFIQNSLASVKVLNISDSFGVAPLPSEFSTPVSLIGNLDKLLLRLFGYKIQMYDWIIKEDFILDRLARGISGDISRTTVPPEKVFNRVLMVIDKNPAEPYFIWVHLYPPHFPYLPDDPYMGMFNSSPRLRTFKSQRRGWYSTFKYENKTQDIPMDIRQTVEILRDRYDEFITYCDRQFGDFIEKLTERDKLKNTVIILSSDHGESFEHGILTHAGPYLYEQVTHIPLIIKEPEQKEGKVIYDLVEQIDIPATILDLAGISIPLWMEGRSLIPLIEGEQIIPRPAFSMNFEGNESRGQQISKGVVAVWEGDYKLIHNLDMKKSLLFNLKEDPDELHDLFSKEPEIASRLIALIHDNLKNANERIAGSE